MKKSISIVLLMIGILLSGGFTNETIAQRARKCQARIQADKEYDRAAYRKAIRLYQDLIESSKDRSIDVYRKLGTCYLNTQQIVLAEQFFKKVAKSRRATAEDYLTYSQILKIQGDNDEAEKYRKKSIKKDKKKKDSLKYADNEEYFKKVTKKSRGLKLYNLSINSSLSEFSPMIYNGNLVYVTNNHMEHQNDFHYRYNNFPFYELKQVKYDRSKLKININSQGRLFSEETSSLFNEGPCCFSATTREFYYTRNDYIDDISIKGKDKSSHLMIYKAEKESGKWGKIVKLPFNSNEYSCCHPTVSPDGQKLVFASDMPGGYGGMDLYYCNRQGKFWSDPVNMGGDVNTSGNECFPFYHNTGIIYFASNGHPSVGGLDIYAANTDDWQEFIITNVGTPINSEYDDFGIYLRKNSKLGYFSSNRPGGKGGDDIYSMALDKPMIFNTEINVELLNNITNEPIVNGKVVFAKKGKVVDTLFTRTTGRVKRHMPTNTMAKITAVPPYYIADSISFKVEGEKQNKSFSLTPYYIFKGKMVNKKHNTPIKNLSVDIYTDNNQLFKSLKTDSKGEFKLKLDALKDYEFNFIDSGYLEKFQFSTFDKKPGLLTETYLIDSIKGGQTFKINNILYALNAYEVPESAKSQLDLMVQFLNQNPKVHIELSSHTDSQGSSQYNQRLSQRRARAAVDYIVSCGIDRRRITYIGYGETRLTNHCSDGVYCNDEEHAANRRTEVKITDL